MNAAFSASQWPRSISALTNIATALSRTAASAAHENIDIVQTFHPQ